MHKKQNILSLLEYVIRLEMFLSWIKDKGFVELLIKTVATVFSVF